MKHINNIIRNRNIIPALLLFSSVTFTGCSEETDITSTLPDNTEVNNPEKGKFTADFIASIYKPITRTGETGYEQGESKRVQSLKYILFKKSTNDRYKYYCEKEIFGYEDGVSSETQENYTWPYSEKISVELPYGEYKVVFVGNMNKDLFSGKNGHIETDEILSYDKDSNFDFEDVMINMPKGQFTDYNMYYLDVEEFSTTKPQAEIVLQRIVCKRTLWRETVSSENGLILTTLLSNVLTHLEGEDPITKLIGGNLGTGIETALKSVGISHLEEILLEPILKGLTPIIEDAVVKTLAPQLDNTLKANNKGAIIQEIINPWSVNGYNTALITMNSVPSRMNLNLEPKGTFDEGTYYATELKEDGNFKYVEMIGLSNKEDWEIGRIDIYKSGLVGGVVIDGIVQDYILPGGLCDTGSTLSFNNFAPNCEYKATYGAITLNVKENYFSQTGETENLTIKTRVGDLINLDELLGGIINGQKENNTLLPLDIIDDLLKDLVSLNVIGAVGDLLNPTVGMIVTKIVDKLGLKYLLCPIKKNIADIEIELTLPININALGAETLEVTGKWGEVERVLPNN